MAEAPDPRSLKSWEEAFETYPVPIVRKLEHQLRKHTDENRQKLRSLVGASYRDLLGTAERIIDMDDQMQRTETLLLEIGRRCNARAVERSAENLERMSKSLSRGACQERYRSLGQAKLLQSTLAVAGRAMKAGGDALLVAKLLVLARLLHKDLVDGAKPVVALEEFRRRLASLRKRLLAYTERMLVRPGMDRSALANTLCAYALITNSTPKDVLIHFLQTRSDEFDLSSGRPSENDVRKMLDLYSQTLSDARALFPRVFADAVSQVSRTPLLQDTQIRSLNELSLDIYGQWVAEDVRKFTPWVRHDQLTASDVSDSLASWAKQAQKALVGATEQYLKDEKDIQEVLNVRRKIIAQYLGLGAKIREESHRQTIPKLRSVFLERLEILAEQQISNISLVLEKPSTTSAPSQNLWQLATENTDLSKGAMKFRNSILQRRNGRDDVLNQNAGRLETWLKSIEKLWQMTQQMRATKWDDDSDLDLDLDEPEDEESMQDALSNQDPETLEGKFRETTTSAIQTLYASVQTASKAETSPPDLLLRSLREINQTQQCLTDKTTLSPPPTTTTNNKELITTLYHHLAKRILENTLHPLTKSLSKPPRPSLALWDGSPLLPVQPSPVIFRLLTLLHKAMAENATSCDLWSPAAVVVLKGELDELVAGIWQEAMRSAPDSANDEKGGVEGEKTTSDGTEQGTPFQEAKSGAWGREERIQWLFDCCYLHRVTGRPPHNDNKGSSKLETVIEELEQSLEVPMDRLRKNANEYWRRTFLLFGLLAPCIEHD
ncbi:Hypothetical protein R9X50_00692100 [Acrodontium crateriforme]|uniref:Conserved oligomeric Golgi complex subunit 1 n=1 Tax=Acrodontium crateriforme TaxID=150365 RepID=A0AAQ3MDL9_9PEZI|nr:Hypothetical protein R9X50_00692100 [Acrodontium crateriforme]